ncbi:Cytochrome p450 protein [Lasiodiplodia theobromae]|uniref:Cytochrome p450 protein n=1 Tax=Lasiodiplodia theobromae TaxID=45133 RepID=UPI0015C35874|nr:Cytochrome p450 protein [Lasiodiplodia theobromae]KAF4543286.1 Cytochrome p450 protein [Lasiodiplodia theobromae]
MPYYTKQMKNAANYVQQCYSPEASGKLGCNTFVKKRLQMGTTVNASCPFSGGICRRDNQTLLLDTGYLDSHEDFGLNAPAEERSYTRYHYGQFDFANYTYEYTNDAVWEAKQIRFRPDTIEYDIGNGSLASQSVFNPIPNLVRTDSDVLLFFLSAGSIFFTKPTSDDWYRATRLVDVARRAEASNDTSENPTIDIFAQDEAASPMACVSQEQYCNPNLPEGSRCGPLSSRLDSWYSSYPVLFPEQAMQDRVKWFWDATLTVDNAVAYLGSQSLMSRNSLSGGAQGPLPDNQWHLDVQHWFETRLAYMQAYMVDLATGPSDVSLQQYVVKPNSTGEQSICHNQKILSTAHISFSLFGLYFIFCLGSFIIVVSYIIEPVLGWLQKRHHRGEYQRLEWCANETLQLQRLAHEGIGFGTWSHAIDVVPVTKRGELLAVLDLENPEHPRLKAPVLGTVEDVSPASGDIESRSAVEVAHSDSIGSGTLQDEGSNMEIVGKEGKDHITVISEKPTRTQTF